MLVRDDEFALPTVFPGLRVKTTHLFVFKSNWVRNEKFYVVIFSFAVRMHKGSDFLAKKVQWRNNLNLGVPVHFLACSKEGLSSIYFNCNYSEKRSKIRCDVHTMNSLRLDECLKDSFSLP